MHGGGGGGGGDYVQANKTLWKSTALACRCVHGLVLIIVSSFSSVTLSSNIKKGSQISSPMSRDDPCSTEACSHASC